MAVASGGHCANNLHFALPDNHTSTSSLNFYGPNAAAQPTVSKHWTHNCFTALWNSSGKTRVSRYQKKHSPTTLIVALKAKNITYILVF